MPWSLCRVTRLLAELDKEKSGCAQPPTGQAKNFPKRAEGLLCANNLYLAALIVSILALIPAMVLNFSWSLPPILLALVGFLVLIPRLACVHCRAKFRCPQAGKMGVRNR
jgi:hypothetical protein